MKIIYKNEGIFAIVITIYYKELLAEPHVIIGEPCCSNNI